MLGRGSGAELSGRCCVGVEVCVVEVGGFVCLCFFLFFFCFSVFATWFSVFAILFFRNKLISTLVVCWIACIHCLGGNVMSLPHSARKRVGFLNMEP